MTQVQLTCPWCEKRNWYNCEPVPATNRRDCAWCRKPFTVIVEIMATVLKADVPEPKRDDA